MSSFRLICIAALTVAMSPAANAAGQTAAGMDQSGRPYLAGLRPPHDRQKPALKTSNVTESKPLAKSKRVAIKQKPVAIARSKMHRPVRLADKINSRVAWPSVEPPAADERATPDAVLQFANEDAASNAAAARPAISTRPASTPKTVPPANIVATEERKIDSVAVDTTPTASTPVQTERFEAPPSTQMRVIMPAPNAELFPTPAPIDQPPARTSSTAAQMLATLAGTIAAGIVGWLMFGSSRIVKSRQA